MLYCIAFRCVILYDYLNGVDMELLGQIWCEDRAVPICKHFFGPNMLILHMVDLESHVHVICIH